MSFRKEKKYRLSLSDQFYIKDFLILEGMTKLHPSRKVISCYMDNDGLDMFMQSEEGVLPRKKVRFRWYGGGNLYYKEVKISSIEGRFKTNKLIKNIDANQIAKVGLFDNEYGNLYSKLIVSYKREYYSFQNLRITFDTNIKYSLPNGTFDSKIYDEETVMEVKVSQSIHDDYIEDIIPYPTSRFSKYCRGILALGYHIYR